MPVYLGTDFHFNHTEKMISYCGRPENYEDLLFDGLIGLGDDDVLIFLGDICIGNDLEVHRKYIEPLRCKKWLVRGNHDTKSDHWYLEHGWDMVCKTFIGMYGNKYIMFSHEPQYFSVAADGKLLYNLNIHGHFHNNSHRSNEQEMVKRVNFRQALLALEYEGYSPIKLQTFLDKYEKGKVNRI